MLNRAIQVRVVKTDENAPPHQTTFDIDEMVDIVKHLGKEGVKVMCLYIALDTVRKVIIANASK